MEPDPQAVTVVRDDGGSWDGIWMTAGERLVATTVAGLAAAPCKLVPYKVLARCR